MVAKAQEVFDSRCMPKWRMVGIAEAAVASNRGPSRNSQVAKAHAVLEMFCGSNYRIFRRDAEAIEARSGSS